VIGILLVFFWLLSELWFSINTWLHENPTAPSFRRLGVAFVIFIAVCLASLINPFTYHIHLLPFEVTGDRWLLENIGELQPPNMHFHNAFELILLGLLLLPMLRAGSIWIYEGLAIVFFAHQALNFQRHIPIFALVAVPPLISALSEERSAIVPPDKHGHPIVGLWGRLFQIIRWLFNRHVDVIIAFVVVAFVFGVRPGKIWERNFKDFHFMLKEAYIPEAYPEKATNFIIRYEIPGRIFNHDNFAGYLIWRLAPEKYTLFSDSRFDLWGSKYAKEYKGVFGAYPLPLGGYSLKDKRWYPLSDKISSRDDFNVDEIQEDYPDIYEWYKSEKPYWKYILDKYEANFILIYDNYNINYVLQRKFQGWYLIFHEGGYTIYLRDKPENMDLIKQFAMNFREQFEEQSN
jgi:hypothetical protein